MHMWINEQQPQKKWIMKKKQEEALREVTNIYI
jgi:hypothetical protein